LFAGKQSKQRDGVHYVIAGSGGGLDLHDLRPTETPNGSKLAGYPGLVFAEPSLGFAALTRLRATGDLRLKLFRVRPGSAGGPPSPNQDVPAGAAAGPTPTAPQPRRLSDARSFPGATLVSRFLWWLKMPRAPPPRPTAPAADPSQSGDEPDPVVEVVHTITIPSRRREWATGGPH
jgi:hypothetical protein